MRILGAGEPTLIFVHGYACGQDDWDRQLDALAKNFRCIAFDLPGHGTSPLPGTVSIEAMAATVNGVKEQVGGSKFVLIGHSMGCRVVTEAYRQSSTNVVGLVFVDGGKFDGNFESAMNSRMSRIDRDGMDAVTVQSVENMFIDKFDPEVRQHITRRALGIDPAFRRELILQLLRWDLIEAEDALKQVGVPVLALQSTYFGPDFKLAALQPGMTTPWLDLVADFIPNAEIEIVPDVGHFTMIEAAPAVNAALARFATKIA